MRKLFLHINYRTDDADELYANTISKMSGQNHTNNVYGIPKMYGEDGIHYASDLDLGDGKGAVRVRPEGVGGFVSSDDRRLPEVTGLSNQEAVAPTLTTLGVIPNYNTDATANIKDDTFQSLLSEYQAQQGGSGRTLPDYPFAPQHLTNEDFYVKSSPLVAGFIQGKVIGSQLITGGGAAQLMPMSPYQYGRDKLENTILQALKPIKPEDIKFELPKIPDVDGRYAPQFKDAYQAGIKKYLTIAEKNGQAGFKALNDQKTQLGSSFKQWQDNMAFGAKNITDVMKDADAYQKIIYDKNLEMPESVRQKYFDFIHGMAKLTTNPGEANFNLADQWKDVKVGVATATVLDDVKKNYFNPIETEIKVANDDYKMNGDYDTYATLMKTIETKYGLAGKTEEELRKQAQDLAKPLLSRDWSEGRNQSDNSPIINKDMLKDSEDAIYQHLKGFQKTMKLQSEGTRKRPPTNINVKVVNPGKDPVPGNIISDIDNTRTNGYNISGSANGAKVVTFVSPQGDAGIATYDSKGNTVGGIELFDTTDAKTYLTTLASRKSGVGIGVESANRAIDEIANNTEQAQGWQQTVSSLSEGMETYDQWAIGKKIINPATKQMMQNYDVYMGSHNVSIPVAGRIVNKFHYSGKDLDKIYFIDNQGNKGMPSPTQTEIKSGNYSKQGSKNDNSTLSELPNTFVNGVYGVESKDGLTINLKYDNGQDVGVKLRKSQLQNYMNTMFKKKPKSQRQQTQTSNQPYSTDKTGKSLNATLPDNDEE